MKRNSLILKIVVGIIFLLAIVGMYMVFTAGGDLPKEERLASPEMASATSFVVNLSLGLLITTVVLVIISAIYTLIMHPKLLKGVIISLVAFVALFGVSYVLASDVQVFGANGTALLKGSTEDIAFVSKMTGTGLYFSYILLVIGGLFFVYDMVKSLIKS